MQIGPYMLTKAPSTGEMILAGVILFAVPVGASLLANFVWDGICRRRREELDAALSAIRDAAVGSRRAAEAGHMTGERILAAVNLGHAAYEADLKNLTRAHLDLLKVLGKESTVPAPAVKPTVFN